MTPFPLHRFQVNKSVAEFLKKREPWIYRRQCSSALAALPVGSLLRLVGPQNEFLALGIFEPLSIAAIRIFAWDDVIVDADFFRTRLRELWQTRQEQARQNQTTAFRWVHGEADGFPGLNIDVYDQTAVGVFYLKTWFALLSPVLSELGQTLGLKHFFSKPPHGQSQKQQDQKNPETLFEIFTKQNQSVTEPLWFAERGTSYPVFPLTGQKTGFYLDLREVRREILSLDLKGKRVLNLFANTGVLSGLCEKQGAREILSVETSARCQNQFLHLQSIWSLTPSKHQWFCEDVWDFLGDDFLKSGKPFDLIILDPPSLAKNQDSQKSLPTVWKSLVGKCLVGLADKGRLLTISCTERLSEGHHKEWTKAVAQKKGIALTLIKELPRPFDHPVCAGLKERDYFHAFHWQKV